MVDRNTLDSFINALVLREPLSSVLFINNSTFELFSIPSKQNWKSVNTPDEIGINEKFDLIIADLPLGMGMVDWEINSRSIKVPRNWGMVLASIEHLNPDGTYIALSEPLGLSSQKNKKVKHQLEALGFFANAVFKCPDAILSPQASITPVLMALTRKKSEQLFVAELLSADQAKVVVENYLISKDGENLSDGMLIEPDSFLGFNRIKIGLQIAKLETEYKTYEGYQLSDLAIEINHVRSGGAFIELENSIYVPKIGNSTVVDKLSAAKLKHHNYFQVVLGNKCINEYVAAYFRSTLGRLVLGSLVTDSVIPHLNKRDLESAQVALPNIEIQKSIVTALHKLQNLQNAIVEFDSELALNPTSSDSILHQLDNMTEVIGGLSDADKVRGIVREGESKQTEFKETLCLDIRKGTKEKHIETSALKTVVAFMNTDGGTLLVGVDDKGVVKGIEEEIGKFFKSKGLDGFLLHWKNLIKCRIGEEFYPYIDYKAVKVEGKTVLMVMCKQTNSPCYLDKNDFYVRTNPATDKLEGPKLVSYVQTHFSE